jgi:Tol biopolymer transport system component
MQGKSSLYPSSLRLIFFFLILLSLASCTYQPVPQPAPQPASEDVSPALFSDADIDEAELSLVSRRTEVTGEDEEIVQEARTLPELLTLETELSAQAVLPATAGFVFYIQKNPSSTTEPFSIFRHDQRSDTNTKIYAGQREIQAVAGTVDGNTLLVSMRETTDPNSDLEIFRLRISPARTQQLTRNTSSDTNVSVSGNGQRLVWEQDVSGRATIILRSYDDLETTSNFFEVSLSRSESQRQPSLSSNGNFIVLVRDLADGRDQLLRFDTRFNSYTLVASVSNSTVLEHPSVNSLGDKILYLQRSATGNSLARLRDLVAGTTQTVVNAATIEHPFLATDGKRITYGLLQSGTFRVFVKDIVTGQQLRLTAPASPVSHEGMSWVVPLAGDTRLTSPSTLTLGGGFGSSVAAEGNTILVGAPSEVYDSGSIGTVYVYQRDLSGQWFLLQRIVHPQPNNLAQFGFSVAISGTIMAIGTPGDLDVNGNKIEDPEERGVGSVYIYERTPGTTDWRFVRRVLNPGVPQGAFFGDSVAITGTTVLVGASGDGGAGSVSVFDKNFGGTNNWGFVKKFSGSDSVTGDVFGEVMAVSGDTLVVGAGGHNNNQGAAYVFERNQGGANTWGEVKKLVASDGKPGNSNANPLNRFLAVAISGSTIVMGTSDEPRDVNGNPGDEFSVGSAYIFERNQGGSNAWGEVKKLVSSAPAANDSYGTSVAIRGDLILVGVPRAFGSVFPISGTTFLYQRNSGGSNNWGETAQVIASDSNFRQRDLFGASSVISDAGIVVAARAKDGRIGAAYVFE